MQQVLQTLAKIAVATALLVTLQACSPGYSPPTSSLSGYSVADAYSSSGVIPVQPYTRSIFNTNNF